MTIQTHFRGCALNSSRSLLTNDLTHSKLNGPQVTGNLDRTATMTPRAFSDLGRR
jgi:hypothetical protein